MGVAIVGALAVVLVAVINVIGIRMNTRQHGTAVESIKGLRDDIADLRTDVSDVKGDVLDVKGEVREIKVAARGMREQQAANHRDNVARLEHLEHIEKNRPQRES